MAAGIFAAAGWLALAAYVVLADPARAIITRDYVTYMTSNAMLIGAEFDKIVSILMVTGILALALRRANNFLSRATTEGITAQELSRFFDAPVASRIRNAARGATPGRGRPAFGGHPVRRHPLVHGHGGPSRCRRGGGHSHRLSDAHRADHPPPRRRHRQVSRRRHHGDLRRRRPSAGFRRRRARALDDIIADTDGWTGAIGRARAAARGAVNGAAAAGEVIFGTLGNEQRLEYTVIGAAVNLAAKLEKCNRRARARALTDAGTFKLAQAQGYLARPRPRRLRFAVSGARQAVVLHEAAPNKP